MNWHDSGEQDSWGTEDTGGTERFFRQKPEDECGLSSITRNSIANEDRSCREKIGGDHQCQDYDRADPLCTQRVFAYLPVRDTHSQRDNGESEQHVRQHRRFARNESQKNGEDPEEEERHDKKEDDRREEQHFVDLDVLEETAREDLSPVVQFPEYEAAEDEDADIEIVAVDERNGRRPGRTQLV